MLLLGLHFTNYIYILTLAN